MGKKNMSGTKITCKNCGYTWLTQSMRHVTSCPRCGWRVKIPHRQQNRQRPQEPSLY